MFDANSRILSKIRTSAVTSSSTGDLLSRDRQGAVRNCHTPSPPAATGVPHTLGLMLLALCLQGCGVVGDILPPTLNLPLRATEMTVAEHGGKLVVGFKMPTMTTEGMLIRRPPEIDLRIGPVPPDPNDLTAWAARATRVPAKEPHAEIPVSQWVNQNVAVAVRLLNDRGKDAGWSQIVVVAVIPPLQAPQNLVADSQPAGVRLKWNSSAPKFRVFRHQPNGPGYEQVATPEKPEYDDAVDFGKEYSYYVQAIAPAGDATAESDNSETVSFTPKDKFPPQPPVGLNFILGGKTIELTWTRNTEADLKGYRVYRAFENNPFEHVTETQESTSYSDRNIEPGKRYRYAVTAIDISGNESKMSEPVVVTAP